MMDSSSKEIFKEFPPYFKLYTDGSYERSTANFIYEPPTVDPQNNVEYKDVLISPETGIKARVFKPIINGPDKKLPLIVHYHGGGFCAGSALDIVTHRFFTSLIPQLPAVVVSIEYRLAPEHPLPIAYDDSWDALQWIVAHANNQGPEPWLNDHVDFNRIFLLGESAGANIVHNITVRAGIEGLDGILPRGLIVVHPYFVNRVADKISTMLGRMFTGCDMLTDPKMNPDLDPSLEKLGCSKVLVCVAEDDWCKPKGLYYFETLKNSDWKGDLELVESEGEDHHCFYLHPECGLLPAVIEHRIHQHPLELATDLAKLDCEYFCDVCEKDLNPDLWAYRCVDWCGFRAVSHVSCVITSKNKCHFSYDLECKTWTEEEKLKFRRRAKGEKVSDDEEVLELLKRFSIL